MASESRFEAAAVTRLVTVVEQRCFKLHLVDAEGNAHVLTLPLAQAVELGCMICDAAASAPFLVGNHSIRRKGARALGKRDV
jgi:hypothetical protein